MKRRKKIIVSVAMSTSSGLASRSKRSRHACAAARQRYMDVGGGGLIASFLNEGEIDEFRIHVIPILIGEGIPRIQPRHRSIALKLLSSKAFPDGVMELNYRVHDHS